MQKRWLMCALVLALLPVRSLWAHQNHDHVLYVAMFGVDQGDCADTLMPCRTIMYAIHQARSKGNQVKVAEGRYSFDQREMDLLTSRQVMVTGSYSPLQGWSQQFPVEHPSFLINLHPDYRTDLELRGFARLEDQPGYEDPYDLMPQPSPVKPVVRDISTAMVPCQNGVAVVGAISYPCNGIDFMSRVPLNQFITAGPRVATDGSNLWGHVDLNTGREYALMGVDNGTAVVDVTDPVNPVVIDTVAGLNSIWREVKVYQSWNAATERWDAYAYISTEASNQGLQVLDLNDLPNSVSVATTFRSDFSSSHTVYVNNVNRWTNTPLQGKRPLLFMNGTNRNSGAFRVLDIDNPNAPLLSANQPSSGYTHDSTSFTVSGDRATACAAGHDPCDIFVDFNVKTVDLWDVTDPNDLQMIGSKGYTGAGYIHSGWASNDTRYIFVQDETDELDFGHNGKVRTLNVSDLANPQFVATWTSSVAAIDHNGYTIDNLYYMSHYRRGLTILNVTNPLIVQEQAFFDTYPSSNSADFNGAWGVYPFLPSGNVLISDIESGLIILRKSDTPDVGQVVTDLQLTGSTPVLLGSNTTLSATINTGSDVVYTWNMGDGSASFNDAATIDYRYAQEGIYTVTVTAENRFNSVQKTFTVVVYSQDTYNAFIPFLRLSK